MERELKRVRKAYSSLVTGLNFVRVELGIFKVRLSMLETNFQDTAPEFQRGKVILSQLQRTLALSCEKPLRAVNPDHLNGEQEGFLTRDGYQVS